MVLKRLASDSSSIVTSWTATMIRRRFGARFGAFPEAHVEVQHCHFIDDVAVLGNP
jgi:hypothetical protein